MRSRRASGWTVTQLGGCYESRVKRLPICTRKAGAAVEGAADLLVDRSEWEMNERNRVIAVLDLNCWRRWGTA